jgi:hypothetical protein
MVTSASGGVSEARAKELLSPIGIALPKLTTSGSFHVAAAIQGTGRGVHSIAIGLSEARKKGKKVPTRKSKR